MILTAAPHLTFWQESSALRFRKAVNCRYCFNLSPKCGSSRMKD